MQISNRVYLAGSQTTTLLKTEQDMETLSMNVVLDCHYYLKLNINNVLFAEFYDSMTFCMYYISRLCLARCTQV